MTRRLVLFLALAVFAAGPATSQPTYALQDSPPVAELTESQMTAYIGALRELVGLGKDAERALGTDPSQAQQFSTGLAYTDKMKGAIESHGFTPESFASTHWNAMMAYAAMEMEKHSAEMEKARADQAKAMEAMRAQLPPEQFEQMKAAMAGAETFINAYQNVPPGNVEIVRARRAELDSILDRKSR